MHDLIDLQCGELSWERSSKTAPSELTVDVTSDTEIEPESKLEKLCGLDAALEAVDLSKYRPEVSKASGEWFISEIDLEFIAEGCGVLGTGKDPVLNA